MVTGYLLFPDVSGVEFAIHQRYMELRREELGYSMLPPQLHIPLGPMQTQLKNASPLVETLAEAAQFLIRLQTDLPQYDWRITPMHFPEAQHIEWRREK